MSYIVTHTSPDFDAIGAAWLLQTYGGMGEADIRFVSAGEPDPAVLAGAAAVVDVGREHDPARDRFDHHQDPALPSATMLVYQALLGRGADVAHLAPLVELIDDGDRFGPISASSRQVGLHAALSGFKAQGRLDVSVYLFGSGLLDDVATTLRQRAEARAAALAHLVWQSDDGQVVAFRDAPRGVNEAAGEVLGARLAVWSSVEDPGTGEPTFSMGCKRLGGEAVTTPHVGELVERAINSPAITWRNPELRAELARWFRHPQGWVAMWGSAKAPRYTAPEVLVEEVAQALSAAWER